MDFTNFSKSDYFNMGQNSFLLFFTTVEKIIARKHFINEISSPTEWLQVTKEIISLRKGRMENRILCRTFVSTKLTVAIQFYTVM